jgi:ribose/xylose/arabinose/galactoside ABC-type transport system permease subunit
MEPRSQIGLMLVTLGILLVAGGLAVMYLDKLSWLGRLPGDINLHGKGWSFHFPLVTGLILSIILTILLNLFFRR